MSEVKLARIELRLETSLLEQIDSLRNVHGASRSEWIRRACKAEINRQQIFYVNSLASVCQDEITCTSVTSKEDKM